MGGSSTHTIIIIIIINIIIFHLLEKKQIKTSNQAETPRQESSNALTGLLK